MTSFVKEADYLDTIRETRDRLVAGVTPFGNAFLDDALGGFFPDDFVLFGAGSGVGKTGLITTVVNAALQAGKQVNLFALEAMPGEIAARMAFEELAKLSATKQDFSSFWRGQTKQQEEEHWGDVDGILRERLSALHTLYKGRGNFTNAILAKHLTAIGDTGLVALDHLHVVDGNDGAELSTQRRTVGLLRDLPIERNIPVVAAAHTRKSAGGETRRLVQGKDDIYGSKHIVGVATVVVMFAPDTTGDRSQPHLAPTYLMIDKDRRGRASPLVARMNYDVYRGRYQDQYTLGRQVWKEGKPDFEPLPERLLPRWAVRETRNVEGKPF
jgi:replicative DNA helicase